MNNRPGTGMATGVLDTLKQLIANLLAVGETRLALVATELDEEITRLGQLALFAAGALFALALGMMLVVVLIIVVFWEAKLLTIGLLAVVLLLAGSLGWMSFLKRLRAKPRPFSVSIGELAKDREELARL